MRARPAAIFATLGLTVATWSCSRTTAKIDETTAAAPDTASVQNPPGYRGMERDTTSIPARADTTSGVDSTTRMDTTSVR